MASLTRGIKEDSLLLPPWHCGNKNTRTLRLLPHFALHHCPLPQVGAESEAPQTQDEATSRFETTYGEKPTTLLAAIAANRGGAHETSRCPPFRLQKTCQQA